MVHWNMTQVEAMPKGKIKVLDDTMDSGTLISIVAQ